MNYQLYIFDWSGTISDDRRVVFEANGLMLDHYGIVRIPYDQWLLQVTMTPIEFFRAHGIHDSGDEIYALYQNCFAKVRTLDIRPTIYEGAHAQLHKLHECAPMAIVSSHPITFLEPEAEGYGVKDLFNPIVGGARDKTQAIRKIVDGTDIAPQQTLYIGDTTHDIRSARRAGVHSAGICTGYHGRDQLAAENPDHLLECLSDLVHGL